MAIHLQFQKHRQVSIVNHKMQQKVKNIHYLFECFDQVLQNNMHPQINPPVRSQDISNTVWWGYNRNLQRFKLNQCLEGWYDVIPNQQWKKVLILQLGKVDIVSLTRIIDLPWSILQEITLYNSTFGNRGLKLLLTAKMPQLLKLQLISCGVSGEAFKHITKGNWPKLQKIMLTNGIHPQTNRVGLQAKEISLCSSRKIRSVYTNEGVYIAVLELFAVVNWDTTEINGVYDELAYFQNQYMKMEIQRIFDTRLNRP